VFFKINETRNSYGFQGKIGFAIVNESQDMLISVSVPHHDSFKRERKYVKIFLGNCSATALWWSPDEAPWSNPVHILDPKP
jgi:hypothetical protein